MAGNRYAPELKAAVLELGARGATYAEIREQFPIAKSTLSLWFNGANKGRWKDKEYMAACLSRARERAHEVIRRNKIARLSQATSSAVRSAQDILPSEASTAKALAAMLYWAEGTKAGNGSAVFTNTDPILARFYLRLLRTSFVLDERKLRVRLHLHHYHDHSAALAFWSEQLGIPQSQFGRIYVKKRSTSKKFRQNFQGICFIVYHDVQVRRELMALGRLLADKL